MTPEILATINSVHARALRALAPIYRLSGRGMPELIGSGTLIEVDQHYFLATAAHVSDHQRTSKVFGGIGTTIIEMPGTRVTSSHRSATESDKLDLSFWELSAGYLDLVQPDSAVTLAECDVPARAPRVHTQDSDFLLTGFVCSQQPKVPKRGQWEAPSYAYATHPYEAGTVQEHADVLRDGLLLVYDKENSYALSGKKAGPDMFGMSGGATWYCPGMSIGSPVTPQLAGIATTWRKAVPCGIRVTPLASLIAGIRAHSSRRKPSAA